MAPLPFNGEEGCKDQSLTGIAGIDGNFLLGSFKGQRKRSGTVDRKMGPA
jgi:hypothetical protein